METNSSNNNQAFSWLMKSVTSALTSSSTTSRGGSPNTNNDNDIGGSRNGISSRSSSSNAKIQIESCNDISNLITGMARDFEALLSLAPSTATTSSSLDVVANGNIANDGVGNDHHTNYRPHENLTARLDRVKTLLYEERSSSVISSSLSVADNNDFSWISSRTRPSGGNCGGVAAEVFRCFTKSYTFIDDENGDHGDVASSSDSKDKEIDVDKVQQQELLPKFLLNLPNLPFESRKSISAIFNYLLVCDSRLDHGSGSDASSSTQFASVSSAFGQYVLERANLIIGTLVVYCRRHHHDCGSLQGGAGGRSEKESSSGGGSSSSIGQGHVDIALLCGSMLRSSLRHASIYQWVLKDDNCEQLVYPFLDEYVHDPNFDVSSDALETVRVMLTGLTSPSGGGGGNNDAYYTDDAAADRAYEEYKQQMESIAAEFLDRQYDPIINDRMNTKCISPSANYMTRRMSLQLLSTILLNRSNFNVMMRYITSSQNLVTILCLLRDPSPHITMDAFQVFKIFVANPGKPPEVVKILFDNKIKLIKYLTNLHKEREASDEQYRDEKGLVIATLEGLEMP